MAPDEHRVLVSVRHRLDPCEAGMGVNRYAGRVAGAAGDVGRLWDVTDHFHKYLPRWCEMAVFNRTWIVPLLISASACGGSPAAPSTSASPAAAVAPSIAVSGAVPLVGQTSQLSAKATFANGVTQDVTAQATWTSSDTTVATVTSTGLLKASQYGTAQITAAYQGATGQFSVVVSQFMLTPSAPLTVTFRTSSNTADILAFFTNTPLASSAPYTLTVELFDGSTRLGAITTQGLSNGGFSVAFLSPASRSTYFGTDRVARVDFSTINSGTSAGKIVLHVSGGSVLNMNPIINCAEGALSCPFLYVAHTLTPATYQADLTELVVTGVTQ